MKNILKPQSKVNAKAVVGNTKKKRNKIKLAYLSLLALLLILSIGYTGYNYLKTHSLISKAASMTYVGARGSNKYYTCKDYIQASYKDGAGNTITDKYLLRLVTVGINLKSNSSHYLYMNLFKNKIYIGGYGSSYWNYGTTTINLAYIWFTKTTVPFNENPYSYELRVAKNYDSYNKFKRTKNPLIGKGSVAKLKPC